MQWRLQNFIKWQKENTPNGVKMQKDMNAQRRNVSGKEQMMRKVAKVLMNIKLITFVLNVVTMSFTAYLNSHCI